MKYKYKIASVMLASTIILGVNGMPKNVYADELDTSDMNTHFNLEMLKSNQIDFLYVIDKEKYKEIINTDTALLSIKERIVIVDSEKISKEDKKKIDEAASFYIVGEPSGEMINLLSKDNFKSTVLGEGRIMSALKMAIENGEDKDLLIANGNSFADSFTALQISKATDKNLILIGNELTEPLKDYFSQNGENKNISFIDGEVKIEDNLKEEILKLSGNDKYQINTEDLIKTGAPKVQLPEKFEDDKKTLIEPPIASQNPLESKESLITDVLLPTTKSFAKEMTIQQIEENEDIIQEEDKVINLELEESTEISELVKTPEVTVIKDDKEAANELVEKFNSVEDDKEIHKITLTHNKPIDSQQALSLQQENKEVFIVQKKPDEKVIKEVMEGKYKDGEARKASLELEGYNYNEVQEVIENMYSEEREAKRLEQERLAAQLAEEQSATQARLAQQNQSKQSSKSYSNSSSTPTTNRVSNESVQASGNVQSFINELTKMQGWEYSQSQRMSYGYADCSSIIVRAMVNAGLTSNASLTTASLVSDSRFHEVSMDQIKVGDILWTQGHTEVYMGGNSTFGAFKPGKSSGYSSGVNRFTRAYRINGF